MLLCFSDKTLARVFEENTERTSRKRTDGWNPSRSKDGQKKKPEKKADSKKEPHFRAEFAVFFPVTIVHVSVSFFRNSANVNVRLSPERNRERNGTGSSTEMGGQKKQNATKLRLEQNLVKYW